MHAIRYLIRFFLLAACAALLHGCASPAYKVTVVAGPGSAALGINAAGHTAGYLDTGAGILHAFANKGAGAADLGTLGGSGSRAWAINDAGHVVGQSDTGDGAIRAFFHDGSTMTDLGTLGGTDSVARAINNDDTVVGSARISGDEWRAFSYANGAMANHGTLPSSGRFYSYGYAINHDGLIGGSSSAGEYTLPEAPVHAFVRRTGGKMVDLGTFGGVYSETFGVNDKGEAVGIAATAELLLDNAFVYSGGVLTDIGNLGGGYAQAYDINNMSEVVGVSGGATPFRGFLYRKGGMVALDTLVEAGWTIVDARAINDSGQIAGTGCKAAVCYAVRLDPGK